MRYDLLDNYYRGEPPLPMGPENCRATFRRFQKKARANWASLIVEAPRERMKPVGFRTAAEGDELGVSGMAGMGQVMRALQPKVTGRAEGGRVAAARPPVRAAGRCDTRGRFRRS